MSTPRVDFYILSEPGADALARTVCRVAEKAWKNGHEVFIHTESPDDAQRLDEVLWTFRQDSFVPHLIDGASDNGEYPVRIGSGGDPGRSHDVLINFSDTVPLFFTRFARVAELVAADDPSREKGRERFRFYKDRECSLQTHNL